MIKPPNFKLRTFLFFAFVAGATSGLLAGRALYVLHVVKCTSELEQCGLQVQSDFIDRYGVFAPVRLSTARSLFEWSLSNPVHVSFLTDSIADTDWLMEKVATCYTVQHVNLSTNNVTINGLRGLLRLPRLERLFLDGPVVNDQALPIIVRSRTLRVLTLANGPITDEGLQQIAGMPALTQLTLCKTNVTALGLAALRRSRPDVTVIADCEDQSDGETTSRQVTIYAPLSHGDSRITGNWLSISSMGELPFTTVR